MPPKMVQIIRHAEKPFDLGNRELSPRGKERAQALAQNRMRLFGQLDYLFASADSDNSVRSVSTIAPLAEVLDSQIDSETKAKKYLELAGRLLEEDRYTAKSVLVCWHHDEIPQFARALRARDVPSAWAPSVFDRIWRFQYQDLGEVIFQDLPQNLLPGDSAS